MIAWPEETKEKDFQLKELPEKVVYPGKIGFLGKVWEHFPLRNFIWQGNRDKRCFWVLLIRTRKMVFGALHLQLHNTNLLISGSGGLT